jgi:hypothetical protein
VQAAASLAANPALRTGAAAAALRVFSPADLVDTLYVVLNAAHFVT